MRRGKRNNRNRNKNRNEEEYEKKPERSSIELKKLIQEELKTPYPTYEHLNGQELYTYFTKNKYLKLVKEQVPDSVASDITLMDASCKNRNREDDTYLHDQELQERMRRGNTLIQYKDRDGKNAYLIARRGLPKFYDLRCNHIRILKGDLTVDSWNNNKTDQMNYYEYRTIVPRVHQAIDKGYEVTVYLSEKANGENAQISYISKEQLNNGQEGFWIACSKNVGMAFRNTSDIKSYTKDRFAYAKNIAKTWLKQLKDLNTEQLENLKAFLADHTFVGEYCGNKKLQHMVKYEKEEIIFYAVVEKLNTNPCLPFEEGKAIIEKMGLPCVSMEAFSEIKSKSELGSIIGELDQRVAKSPVEELGEGSVVYYEAKDPETGKVQVLNLCKLKTLDYRFWRKLREKLKNFLNNRYTQEKLLQKYEKEMKELRDEGKYETCYPLDYYLGVGKLACEIINNCFVTGEHLRTVYLDFLTLVRKCYKEGRRPIQSEKDYFKNLDLAMDRSEDEEDWNASNETKVPYNESMQIRKPKRGEMSTDPTQQPMVSNLVAFGKAYEAKEFLENYVKRFGIKLNVYNVEEAEKILKDSQSSTTIFWSYLSTSNAAEVNFISQDKEEITKYQEFSSKLEELQQEDCSKSVVQGAYLKQKGPAKYAKIVSTLFNWFGMSKIGEFFRFQTVSLDSLIVKQLGLWDKIGKFLEDDTPQLTGEISEGGFPTPKPAPRDNILSVIVFYGLSCIGKTHYSQIFKKICEEKGIQFYSVSSDESSRTAMDAYIDKNPEANEDDAFTATKKQAITIFNNGIKKVVSSLKTGPAILFLDKVMHGGRFLGSFEKSFPCNTHEIRMVAIYPWSDYKFMIGKTETVPFSASLILNIAHRMVNRESHDTVSGTAMKKLFLALSFVLLYKNVRSIEKVKAKDCNYHSFYTLNFGVGVPPYATVKHDSNEIPKRWLEMLRNTMKQIVAFRSGEKNCEQMANMLLNDCEDLKPFIGFVPDAQIYNEISGLIENIF